MTDAHVVANGIDLTCASGDELRMHPIDGGLRVKRAGDFYVDVLVMMYNFRVVATPIDFPLVYDRFYCYAGKSRSVFVSAVLAAAAWNPCDGSEPAGWNKNGQTREWIPPSDIA